MIKNKKVNNKFSCFPFIKGKKGWTKLIEAFISILLIAIILLLILSESVDETKDISEQIHEQEIAILKKIELNNSFRTSILNVAIGNLPLGWNDFETNGLTLVKDEINSKVPSYLNCVAYLCLLEDSCVIGEEPDEELYVQQISIISNLETYFPRKLKLFCWLN